MLGNPLTPQQLKELDPGKIIRLTAPTFETGWITVKSVEQRGESWWIDATDGQAFLLPPLVKVEVLEPIGTFDFLTQPSEKFYHIYQAYDKYDDTRYRLRRRCACIVCRERKDRLAPSGRLGDGQIIDDLNFSKTVVAGDF